MNKYACQPAWHAVRLGMLKTTNTPNQSNELGERKLYAQPFDLKELQKLLGLPVDEEPSTHKHKCGKCGLIWEHETNDCLNNTPAHNCRECGTEQWERHEGETGKVPFISCLAA